VDSSSLVSAMTSSEGTMTMGVASGPDSGGAEETDGMSCGGVVVGRAALIGNFARERLGLAKYTMAMSSLKRRPEVPRSQNT
jgi:hypothetical protein